MAPLNEMSAPGTASYNSDTMEVGDGTWDFTKNDFLLPNLVGLNFETMQYNGMGNRFSTLAQYHTLIKAHGIIGAIVFLFIVPIAILYARFYTKRPGYAIRYHAYLQILAVLLTTVVFILGYFSVGPERSLTNPHHGIGVAIYTLILLQIIGGRLIKNIRGRSLRVMLHQWFGRTIALLGIAQVPLGLTLYGSPKFTFILFAVWMAFLLLLYFILEYRAYDRPDYVVRDGRSEIVRTERKSSGGGWLGPLAAGGAAWALLRGRKRERSRSRSRSRASRAHSRSRSRAPEVIPSRRASYIEDEKYTDRYSERPRKSTEEHGGGFMNKFLGVGAGLGAGALIGRMMGKRKRGVEDDEYSAVATDTPSRRRHSRSDRRHGGTVYSDESEEYHRHGHRSPLLPGPGGPSAMAAAVSAAEARPGARRSSRPITPPPSHRRGDPRMESVVDSDYSSYVSPSRRERVGSHSGRGAAEKGLLAGLGLGWFAKKMRDRREQKEEDRMRIEEDERRAGHYSPRYTGDGYSPRRDSHRASIRPAGPPRRTTSPSRLTEESSLIEPRPLSGYESHPPLEPLPTGGYRPPPTASGPAPPPVGQYANLVSAPAPGVVPVPMEGGAHSATHSRQSIVDMPLMPSDPHGVLHTARSSESESYLSRRDRRSESRRRAGEDAAAAAAASAGILAAEQEAQRRVESDRETSKDRTPPVSVKVKVHDDKDRNVTLRRLTEQERQAAHRARRQRTESMSSLSGSEAPGGSSRTRYRRDTSRRRAAEEGAESAAESSLSPLPQPTPAFAGGKRPKDSAYYSGQPLGQVGPAGTTPAAGATVSSLGSIQSPGSHGTWSGMSPVGPSVAGGPPPAGPSEASATASAADRRRRRRLERQNARPGASGTVDFT
ncbi:hypothetical protein J7T55_009636 [Diaporthe amygdali]|uniref:uncharacterized protein n=1 Tax=Phomopsis amygdali TaxID=1214568 RepID=UPI0022FE73B8|nr:uncharacterized protein J7T55_009636 [Diaporthe amygdali]KAJ0109304.1 hypothetical protein J7T55_009636 [Diaporthe amygdali]